MTCHGPCGGRCSSDGLEFAMDGQNGQPPDVSQVSSRCPTTTQLRVMGSLRRSMVEFYVKPADCRRDHSRKKSDQAETSRELQRRAENQCVYRAGVGPSSRRCRSQIAPSREKEAISKSCVSSRQSVGQGSSSTPQNMHR